MPNKHGHPETLTSFTGKWRNGATKTIRVPIVLAEQVIALARELDESSQSHDTNDSTQSEAVGELSRQLLEIKAKIEAKEAGFRANSASKLISALKAVFSKLDEV